MTKGGKNSIKRQICCFSASYVVYTRERKGYASLGSMTYVREGHSGSKCCDDSGQLLLILCELFWIQDFPTSITSAHPVAGEILQLISLLQRPLLLAS